MRVGLRVIPFQLWFVLCFAGLWTPARSAEPQLTTEQRQQLEEANRLNTQVLKLYQQGQAREAVKPAQQALAIRKRVLGEKHPLTAQSLNNLGSLLQATGDYI